MESPARTLQIVIDKNPAAVLTALNPTAFTVAPVSDHGGGRKTVLARPMFRTRRSTALPDTPKTS